MSCRRPEVNSSEIRKYWAKLLKMEYSLVLIAQANFGNSCKCFSKVDISVFWPSLILVNFLFLFELFNPTLKIERLKAF